MPGKQVALQAMTRVATTTPPSFNGDTALYLWNLFLMTAFFFLGLMMAAKYLARLWRQRRDARLFDPITFYRLILFFAGTGVMLRCGAEALLLWGWSPTDHETTVRVIMAKRWIDPASIGCAFMWMSLSVLGEPGIETQLRRPPLPTALWSRWPTLARCLGVFALSFVAASAAVLLR